MKRNVQILLAFSVAAVTSHTVVLGQAPVARVGDVTRLQGQGINTIVGSGLVIGLQKTGDGDKYLPTMNKVLTLMRRFGAQVDSVEDLGGTKNVAFVQLSAVISDHGAREGDRFDVTVTSYAAKSLVGGRLLAAPLIYHDRAVEGLFAFAQGQIVLEGEVLTAGVIRGGARMERDVFINVISKGAELQAAGLSSPWIQPGASYVTLVLDEAHAGWSMAAAIAQAVDKELSISADVDRVALAMDSKNIVVLLPEHQRTDPASWIRDVERTPILMESNEARVTINRSKGTIVITGDTRMSPVVISQMGLTVTVANALSDGSIPQAAFTQQDFIPLDSAASRPPNVRDLLEGLNRLKVPFGDRVSILEEVHRAGKLHARLMYEG